MLWNSAPEIKCSIGMLPISRVNQTINGAMLIRRKYTNVPAIVENLLPV